jgi:folate-binding protein YgfZ
MEILSSMSSALSLHPMSELMSQLVASVRNSFGYCETERFAVLLVHGKDAPSFLQNRLSNDVLALSLGQGQLNAALDRHGKIEGLFSIHATHLAPEEPAYLILAEAAEAEILKAAILRFKIVEQVQVNDLTAETSVYLVQGPKSAELLTQVLEISHHETAWPEYAYWDSHLRVQPQIAVRIVRRSLTGEDGAFLLLDKPYASVLDAELKRASTTNNPTLNGLPLSHEALESLRVEAGIPRFGFDYSAEALLPETGLEKQAASFTKGCYLGQEVIAKVNTYGGSPRLLCGLLFDPQMEESIWNTLRELPALQTALRIDNREVGRLCSVAWSYTLNRAIAIASLGRQERIPGKNLDICIGNDTYHVTVTLLPFVTSVQPQQFSNENPTPARVLLKEGLRLFSQNQETQARELLQEAIRQDAQLAEAYEALGVITARQDTPDAYLEAINLMNKLLELDPEHVLAHTNLSVYYMKLGDKDKAEDEKAKATMTSFRAGMKEKMASQPPLSFEEQQAAERLALEKKRKALLERVELFQQALHYEPNDPMGNFGLASVLLELDRFEEAIVPLQKTISAQPKHSTAYLSLGKALENSHRQTEAIEIYRQGIIVAAAKGDMMPLRAMQQRLAELAPES